ncbi:helix-turn-helix transcriptional regulator [Tropicibacter oceani]|uniref:AraC family transcriptional regulator n=1 Tax=Tropicibacter oceani TaxID=3058420 RepID=A0ABY8QDU8_9RHOB|nr:AraC family transcriptional regulator [Tropicibacter oceani]WGW02797.1 AraC family transcriptional regulator [Tropicibacter oceani]
MSTVPTFLRKAMPPPPAPKGPISCGSFGLAAQGAPWKYTLHHDRAENFLLWITRGQGRVTINGIRRGVSMHSALYLPAGTLMSIDLPNTAQALYLESPAGLTGTLPKEPLLLRVRDSLAQAELTGAIDTMQRELAQRRPFLDDAIAAHVSLVGVWLNRQLRAGSADAPKEKAAERLTRRFAQMVTRDYRTPMLMADYAEALDVTPTHLTRVCRQCSGRTAADILTERKLHAARIALERPKPTVQQVARDLGFASPAYFTRFMQNHTGLSPSALRNRTKARA